MAEISSSLLQEFTHRLVDEFQPEEIILFGSQAWGRPNQDSDLDLLVIISHSDLSPARRAMSAHQCLQGLNVSKAILVRTRPKVERFRHVWVSLERQIFLRRHIMKKAPALARAFLFVPILWLSDVGAGSMTVVRVVHVAMGQLFAGCRPQPGDFDLEM